MNLSISLTLPGVLLVALGVLGVIYAARAMWTYRQRTAPPESRLARIKARYGCNDPADCVRRGLHQSGQGLAEYALILGLIAIVAIVAVTFLGQQVSSLLSKVGKGI